MYTYRMYLVDVLLGVEVKLLCFQHAVPVAQLTVRLSSAGSGSAVLAEVPVCAA